MSGSVEKGIVKRYEAEFLIDESLLRHMADNSENEREGFLETIHNASEKYPWFCDVLSSPIRISAQIQTASVTPELVVYRVAKSIMIDN